MDAETGGDVLVVEDDPDMSAMVGAYAEVAGFSYRAALDGMSALRELKTRRPALVLLDLMLPDIDGFEVYRRLLEDESTRTVPVVILSGLSEDAARARAANMGVRAYVTKPFDPDQLILMMTQHAERPGGP